MTQVTKAFLPDRRLFDQYLERIWSNGWITNHGELSQELTHGIKQFLGVENLLLTANGTLPLQMALKALGVQGEVITTPFSYIATSAAIVWQNLRPVFVDIDPEYFTIDESKIEEAITENTSAILATHVFGNPCNVQAIEEIASRHKLKVIYDAAHCFGVKFQNQSVFKYGDVSTCSFHATKLFHTAEGGAIFTNSPELMKVLEYTGNFGHKGSYDFYGLGINAKMSELHAAMGLCLLESIDEIIKSRKNVVSIYEQTLKTSGIRLMKLRDGTEWNYSYFPIIFDSHDAMLACLEKLADKSIYPRRYFYPSLNTVNYLNGQSMPIAEAVAENILCLPVFHDLAESIILQTCDIVNQFQTEKPRLLNSQPV